MADVTVLPLATYAASSYVIPSTAIADGVSSVQFAVRWCTDADLTIWPSAGTTCTFDFQASTDNGATWQQWYNASGAGGIHLDKFGNQMPNLYFSASFPAGTSRRVKGTVTLSGSIRTSAVLTVL